MSHASSPLALAAALMGLLIVGSFLDTAGASAAGTPDPGAQRRFMWAMAGQESGWDYYARNTWSGAFGKYQIMPFNWPAWARTYLGDARADQTPWNQERVAFGKIRDLYRWLGSWKRVAYWWLTGSTERRERRWSSYARGYVRSILRLRARAPRDGGRMPRRSSASVTRGDWRRSGIRQRLRMEPGGRAWARRGVIRDGDVVRVRAIGAGRRGGRWMRVVTADGRTGWLPRTATLPAHRPERPRRWHDVRYRGPSGDVADRRHARPVPR